MELKNFLRQSRKVEAIGPPLSGKMAYMSSVGGAVKDEQIDSDGPLPAGGWRPVTEPWKVGEETRDGSSKTILLSCSALKWN